MMKKEKYAVLAVDTECGGDAFLYTINREELIERIGSYDSYNVDSDGLKLYNDSDDSYDSVTILNKKGFDKYKKVFSESKPFDLKSINVKEYLKSESDEDEDY